MGTEDKSGAPHGEEVLPQGEETLTDEAEEIHPELGSASGGVGSDEVLRVVEKAMQDHLEWLQRFHRSLICKSTPPRDVASDQARFLCSFGAWVDLHRKDDLVQQPAFRTLISIHDEMHDDVAFLVTKAKQEKPITEEIYNLLSEKVVAFYSMGRRILAAFQSARSDLDPLTGLYNRQIMLAEITRERERSLRSNEPCCIVLADLDFFKKINDTYGHAAGDQVLQACAMQFLKSLRPYDMVFRYGGEEFLFCLPNADTKTAQLIMDRLRETIAGAPIKITGGGKDGNGFELPVTVSFGIAPINGDISLKENMEQADKALYMAKEQGRNKVSLWQEGAEEKTKKRSDDTPS
ncbi:MAG: diguanylate cyclase [Rhodospirillaceae bacterium]|jgi:diguanylate cyclase|nr:diguanylate cyclase [Rhodospirillaceae bacterium]